MPSNPNPLPSRGARLPLTRAEEELLRLLLVGTPNKLVAGRLGVAIRTVERRRADIYRKLGVATLVEAALVPEVSHLRPAAAAAAAPTASPWPTAEVPDTSGPDWFATAFRNAACGFIVVDLSGRFLAVNESFCRLVGRSEGDLLAADVGSVTYPSDRGRDATRNRAFFRGEIATFRTEKRYVRPEGAVVSAYLVGSLVRGPDRTPRFGVGTVLAE